MALAKDGTENENTTPPSNAFALWFQFQLCAYFPAFVRIAVNIDVKLAVFEVLVLLIGKHRTGRNSPLAR